MWFEKLTGFPEESPEQVRQMLRLSGEHLVSQKNGKRFRCGTLETPNLTKLRTESEKVARPNRNGRLRVEEVVADVQDLHADIANAGALFQVASQFNLLEMINPKMTPEHGVDIYAGDHTQGPACAIACGAATIYRNYFVPVGNQFGQSQSRQIDCLSDLGLAMGNDHEKLWAMQNGYALATKSGLEQVSRKLDSATEEDLDSLRCSIRIGVQSDAGVTIRNASHSVSQAFCSALPVAYSKHAASLWKRFAVLILEAAYEATFHAAVINASRTGNNRLFLTMLGGGAFGNRTDWIVGAIMRSLKIFRRHDLKVSIVSYGQSQTSVSELASQFHRES